MPPLRFLRHVVASLLETSVRRLIGRPRRRGWPFGFELVVGTLRRNFLYSARLPVEEARRFQEAVASAQPFKHPVVRKREVLAGVPVERFVPRDVAPQGVMLYLHGGSYLMGSPTTHADLIARLVLAGSFEALAVEYRLAPEHRVEDAVADVCAVYGKLLEAGHSNSTIAFAGDSAGGGLAFLAAVALRDAAVPLPAAIAAIAPWGDLSCPGASIEAHQRFDWATAEVLREQGRLAAGQLPPESAALSPRHANLRGMPPTLIHVGDAEMMRDGVLLLAEALREAGVDVEVKVWPDMIHDFHLLADLHPAAREATEALAAFLRSYLSSAAVRGEVPAKQPA